MITTIELDVKLWVAPNFVLVKNPDLVAQDLSLPLSAIDAVTLERLCDQFRDEVFKKAGKPQPAQEARRCPKCERTL